MMVIAGAFGAGIVGAAYVGIPICVLLASAGVAAGLVAPGRFRTGIWLALALFLLGSARYCVGTRVAAHDVSRSVPLATAFEGYVAADPDRVADRLRLECRVERVRIGERWRRAAGRVLVTVYDPAEWQSDQIRYGDRVRILARPYRPLESSNPSQFSYRDYLARQGIYACASVRKPQQIELLPGRRAYLWVAWALAAKRHIAQSIHRVHPEKEASLVAGMMLGTYAYLPEDTFEAFSRSGTLHLLAASGYNCYILLFLAAPLLARLGVLPKRRNIAVIALVIIYVLMVGPKSSLMRAAIMASLLLVALPLGRVPNLKNLFFAAAFILLLIKPTELFEVGFQLSFLSVWALIWIEPVLVRVLHATGIVQSDQRQPRRWWKRQVWKAGGALASAAVGTVTISLVTGPIVAYYFNYVSLVSIPANVALALGVPLVFADAVTSAVLAPVPYAGALVGWLGTWLARGMLGIVETFGSQAWAAKSVASPGLLALAGYYLVLAALVSWLRLQFAKK